MCGHTDCISIKCWSANQWMYLCIVFYVHFRAISQCLKKPRSRFKKEKNVNSSLYIGALDQLIICITRHITFGIPSKDLKSFNFLWRKQLTGIRWKHLQKPVKISLVACHFRDSTMLKWGREKDETVLLFRSAREVKRRYEFLELFSHLLVRVIDYFAEKANIFIKIFCCMTFVIKTYKDLI